MIQGLSKRILSDLPLLTTIGLTTGYAGRQVLNGINLQVSAGEIVAIIGHNGAGKSTFLKAIFGLIPIWSGSLAVSGVQIAKPTPQTMGGVGVAYLPQGNQVFAELTVLENLMIGSMYFADATSKQHAIDRTFQQYRELKVLQHRRASTLSGGEKQLLALASVMMRSPRLLLLDEPSLGLAPNMVLQIFDTISRVSRDSGTAVLIVEQKVKNALAIAQNACVLRRGVVTFSGCSSHLLDDRKLREAFL